MRIRVHTLAGILALMICLPLDLYARRGEGNRAAPNLAFMKVRLNSLVKFSRLKHGNILRGIVTQNVFSGYRLIVPRNSHVALRVSRMKRAHQKPNNLWPWPIRSFCPKYEYFPTFDFADVALPDGNVIRIHIFAVSAIDEMHVTPHTKARKKSRGKANVSVWGKGPADQGHSFQGPTLELVADAKGPQSIVPSGANAFSLTAGPGPRSGVETLTTGSHAKLALMDALSASKSRVGAPFEAILEEPVRLNSGDILPEGTIFEGHVTKSIAPRWLSRPGSLYMTFTRLIIPRQAELSMAASLDGIDVSRRAPIRMNSEGGMTGGSPGKARLLIDLGVGVGISKVTDDSYQLVTEALISTATDASTAGTARLIGLALSGLYLLTRRGRDVTLPRYTTITLRFDRPPSLPPPGSNHHQETMRRANIRSSKD